MLGLEGLELGSWNRLDRDQSGIDKIGWELGWITIKRKLGLGFNKCEDDERVGKSGVGVIGKIE